MIINMLSVVLAFFKGVQTFVTGAAVEALASPVGNLIVANSASTLAGQVRDFIAPLALITCAILALTFLVRRQMMQMLIFIVIAVLVFAIFYAPEMLASLGEDLGRKNSNMSWS